jgi:dTMP kinase
VSTSGSPPRGLFIAFEGGEGAGKSTQVKRLAEALRDRGREVVTTFEPGDTPLGKQLRGILLGHDTGPINARAEALLYAADRAEHVATVVRPALERGAVCISDRYIDSSVAYQGAGRALAPDDITQISEWATDGLWPDLTVLLDIDPAVGLTRFDTPADRLESEPVAFHRRVREHFLERSRRAAERYLVIDASHPADDVAAEVWASVQGQLP